MANRTVFTSYQSYEDAINQAKRAGYTPVGSTSRMQGGQQIFIIFAEQGFGQRVANSGDIVKNKIWG